MKLILTFLDNIYSINTYQITLNFDQGTYSFAFYESKFSNRSTYLDYNDTIIVVIKIQ